MKQLYSELNEKQQLLEEARQRIRVSEDRDGGVKKMHLLVEQRVEGN